MWQWEQQQYKLFLLYGIYWIQYQRQIYTELCQDQTKYPDTNNPANWIQTFSSWSGFLGWEWTYNDQWKHEGVRAMTGWRKILHCGHSGPHRTEENQDSVIHLSLLSVFTHLVSILLPSFTLLWCLNLSLFLVKVHVNKSLQVNIQLVTIDIRIWEKWYRT